MKPRILICNDDGVYGQGLRPLIAAMKRIGRVTVVVPDQERSADSHSLTLHKPLRVREVAKDFYIMNGSAADCARFGILEIMQQKVDFVASGINQGFNLGEDVIYSGTVAGAMEGTLLKIPAAAFSQGVGHDSSFSAAAAFARKLALKVLKYGLPEGVCLNVNIPDIPAAKIKSVEIAKLGKRDYGKKVTVRSDPRGHRYFWLAGKNVSGISFPGSDVAAIDAGSISVTPLHIDNTHLGSLPILKKWNLQK